MKFMNVTCFDKKKLFFKFQRYLFFILTSYQICFVCSNSQRVYTNQFALQVLGGDCAADKLALQHGFINKGQIGSLEGYYLFEHHNIQKRSLESSKVHHELLLKDSAVLWIEQQHVKHRVKRDLSDDYSYTLIPDPLYPEQWFLHQGGDGGYDMNVIPAWAEGFTGKGVVVSILDDGIQTNHPDLAQNYDKKASLDINGVDDDPMPQFNGDNNHGTRCAGEVAAVAFNEFCGVGVAYNASIGGVRMLDGTVTDATEAHALGHNPNHIHIYSASWGPEDDGKKVDGPGRLAKTAFLEGITKGRSGLGSIFVWASGNGGKNSDCCNCDGYTNSIYTLSISSATQRGTMPWYLEQCSSTLATTYSSGTSLKDKSIVTVDVDDSYLEAIANDRQADPSRLCTKSHTGTSASAPIAAGICALALQANPMLTWRDMQYIVLITSNPEPLQSETGWVKNGVARYVSSKFGYGLMDAAAMVKLAKRWTTVPSQHICETEPDVGQRIIPHISGEQLEVSMNTSGCKNAPNSIIFLEHVQVKVTLYFKPRGNLRIILQSPAGTPSTVLLPRIHDSKEGAFNDWPFMSVHFWGENCEGTWKLIIINDGNSAHQPGKLLQWSLVFYGTNTWPINLTEKKRNEHRSTQMLSVSYENLQDEAEHVDLNTLNKCSQNKKFKLKIDELINCVDKCPKGHFGDIRSSTCNICNKSCQTCYGTSFDNCLSCSSQFYLIKNSCSATCPRGYYPDNTRMECLPCSGNCYSCQHSHDDCLSCKPHFFLLERSCVPMCPEKTFTYKSVCQVCHPKCASCYGTSSNECLDCIPGLFLLNGTCVSSCPSTFYSDENNKCSRCSQICKTCSSDRMCTSCHDGFKIKSNECVPLTKYKTGCIDKVSKNCNVCSENCSLCIGPNPSDCIKCEKGFYWSGYHCTKSCADNHYILHGECHSCPFTCQKCSHHYNSCILCQEDLVLFHGHCLSSCPFGFYLTEKHQCKECISSCAQCKGGTAADCTLCEPRHYLLNNTCFKECPHGYFAHKKLLECMPCHPMCKTCSGFGPSGCTSCYSDSVFVDSSCIPCFNDEYFDEVNKTCIQCHSKCSKCSGPSEFDCVSCVAPLRLDQTSHSCMSCCSNDLPKTSKCCMCDKNTIFSQACVNSLEHPRSINGMNFDSDMDEVVIPMNHVVPIVVAICVSAIVLYVVLFGILQAHSMGWCHSSYPRGDYKRVPNTLAARFDAEMEAVSLTQDDPDEEEDIYERA